MRFTSWLKKSQERILAIGWRLALFEAFNWVFNNPIYFWAMSPLGYGLVTGWLIMSTISLVMNAGFFWRYDRNGIDWLFANAARKWEEGTQESSGRFRRLIVKISKSRDGYTGILTFILASISIDPVIVAVHYRKSHFSGISVRDWSILVASTAIGNLWWGARIGLFVEILKLAVRHF